MAQLRAACTLRPLRVRGAGGGRGTGTSPQARSIGVREGGEGGEGGREAARERTRRGEDGKINPSFGLRGRANPLRMPDLSVVMKVKSQLSAA